MNAKIVLSFVNFIEILIKSTTGWAISSKRTNSIMTMRRNGMKISRTIKNDANDFNHYNIAIKICPLELRLPAAKQFNIFGKLSYMGSKKSNFLQKYLSFMQ
jgi:hypothetical protein